jgi:hypothetical protein
MQPLGTHPGDQSQSGWLFLAPVLPHLSRELEHLIGGQC